MKVRYGGIKQESFAKIKTTSAEGWGGLYL
jgi:hypothetical protein